MHNVEVRSREELVHNFLCCLLSFHVDQEVPLGTVPEGRAPRLTQVLELPLRTIALELSRTLVNVTYAINKSLWITA